MLKYLLAWAMIDLYTQVIIDCMMMLVVFGRIVKESVFLRIAY